MTTGRLQRLVAHLATRMGKCPRMNLRIVFLTAETRVPRGNGRLGIVLATLRTVPIEHEGRLWHKHALVRVVSGIIVIVVVHLLLR